MDEHEALGLGRKWTFVQLKKIIVKRLRTGPSQPAPGITALNTSQHVPQTKARLPGPPMPPAPESARLRPADDVVLSGKMGKWLGG